jgi:hypothetical protein
LAGALDGSTGRSKRGTLDVWTRSEVSHRMAAL